ncbi:hypothetical protein BLAT2472_40021 [Burkholderia latens]
MVQCRLRNRAARANHDCATRRDATRRDAARHRPGGARHAGDASLHRASHHPGAACRDGVPPARQKGGPEGMQQGTFLAR